MKIYLILLLFIIRVSHSNAQDVKIDTFHYLQNSEQINLYGIHLESNEQLAKTKLFQTMYPVSIVPYPVLEKIVSIGNRQSILADSLSKEVFLLEKQNSLNELEIDKKDRVIEYQKQFIVFSDSTNQMLNKSIGALNLQLDGCRKAALSTNNDATKSKIWGALIGGGIGLGVGVLLGVIAGR